MGGYVSQRQREVTGSVERVAVRPKRIRGTPASVQVSHAEARGDAPFEDAPEAYLITHRTGKILRANREAALFLRETPAEVQGRSLFELVASKDEEVFERLRDEAGKNAGVYRARLRLRPRRGVGRDAVVCVRARSQGVLLWLLFDAGALASAIRKPPSRRLAFRMRERIASLEKKLRERQGALTRERATNLAKHRIVASGAAELLTAVGVVLGWTRLLLADLVAPEEQKRVLATIERSAFAEGEIAAGLLDIAKMEAGKLTLDFGPVDLRELLTDVVRAHAHLAEVRGVSLLARLGDNPCRTSGDRARLERAFGRCVSGALARTPVGGTVAVSLEHGETWALVRIEHAGEVVPLEASLAPPILELHGGAIHSESDGAGGATRLWAVLPLFSFVPPLPGSPRRLREAGLLAGKRVLVVGERRHAADGASTALRNAGAEVFTALGPAVGFAMLTHLRPAALVVDLAAGEESGLALVELARATLSAKEGGAVPAIALTSSSAPADAARRALAAGFQTHVRASAGPARLVALVQAAIH